MNLGYRRMITAFAAGFASLLLALPAVAAAATSKYPSDPAARGFGGGLAGWSIASSFGGTCAPPLLCPSASGSFQPSGGADGGGYIRSAYQGVAGVTAVGGTSTVVFTSPRFEYRGAGGRQPGAVSFEMDRQASVDELLAVAGNSATFSVRLIDTSDGGEALTLIPPTTLAGANSWSDVPPASVDPGQLTIGHEYQLAITSTYTTGTGVLVSGNADFDNVALSAVDAAAGKGGHGKGGGGGGSDGSALDRDRLLELMRNATPGTAVVTGKGKSMRLLVRVKCPRKVGRTCRIATQGLLRKRKPATGRRNVKLRKGKAKLVVLRVKPKARRQLAQRKRLLVRHKVRAGKVSVVVYKKRKLIRR